MVLGLLVPIVEIANINEELEKTRPRRPLTQKEIDKLHEQKKMFKEEIKDLYREQAELIKLYVKYQSIGNEFEKDRILKLCSRYGINLGEEFEYGEWCCNG